MRRRSGSSARAGRLLLLGAAALIALFPRGSGHAAAAARPRLVLVLSVDQMRPDYLDRFRPLFRGGFKTLLERAAVFENARYRHANCETGPGHSVLLSGRDAWQSGIVANTWYDSELHRLVNVVDDPSVSPLGGEGRAASPAHFVGFTVGDMLKKATPGSRVVGISLKDRSAILMAGPRADAAYWFEPEGGNFVTSSYYMKAAPAWLQAFNAQRRPDAYAGKTWSRLLPDENVYLEYAGADDAPGEGAGADRVFPHAIRGAPPSDGFYDSFRDTPFADELTLDAALEAMRAHDLGSDAATDILAIGFSATDMVGHSFGPDSQEMLDQMLRLDRTLGRLFEAVDARVGLDRTLLVLSSDHAVMPLVELLQARGVDAARVSQKTFEDAVNQALAARFPGARGLVAAFLGPDVQLDLEQIRRQGLRRPDVEAAVTQGLLSTGLVLKVYTAAQLVGDPPPDDPFFDPVRRSFFEPRSPQVLAVTKPYLHVSSSRSGTGHGTPHDYDRHVPLLFMGASLKPGRYAGPSAPEDVAPTLGALLELDYPLQDAQRVLDEMFVDGGAFKAPAGSEKND